MNRRFHLAALAAVLAFSVQAHAQAPAPAKDTKARQLDITTRAWTGDFDQMIERRAIRVYVPYSRSLYFVDKGRERGLAAELVRDFERWVNKKYEKELGKRPLTIYVVAATRDKLLTDLREGHADIAVGNITVTAERQKVVDFIAPDEKVAFPEILVTGPASPAIATIDDLSGKTVHVRKTSSYHESLVALNERLKKAGKPPVALTLVPDALEDEDMMEMLNAGLLQAIVVDDWKAKLWVQVLPKMKLRSDIVLREPTKRGWAIRKDSPKLTAALNEFYTTWVVKSGVIPYRLKQYMGNIKSLNNPGASADAKRFEQTVGLFDKYGKQYKFDPLMLAAQGYQESGLNQDAKSHVGAIGIMQIMPATGKELKVGDISVAESNVHGGTKYMDQLMTKYFVDAKFDEQNRTLFAFAAYNCGPGNVQKMRTEATKRGLNPDVWFNNVEVVTAEKIGIETTTYVRNIFKYYVSYKLTQDAQAQAKKLKEQVAPKKG